MGSGFRAIGVFTLSLGTTLGVIYTNYYNYWEGTIYRTQTVDFNILSNLLPTKLSILLSKAISSKSDTSDLQQAIDSNYGLFGIIVTDCTVVDVSCPKQKILFASQSTIKNGEDGQQKVIPRNDYAKIWTQKFEDSESLDQVLGNSSYIVLYNPPPLYQEWGFRSPREDEQVYFQKNKGDIIGRAYLLRADRPSFVGELQRWLQDIPTSLSIGSAKKRISSRSLVYNSIVISTLITGLLVLLGMEFAYYLTRVAQENEAKSVKDKLNTEKKLREAEDRVKEADQQRQQSEERVRIADEKSEQAIQEKLKAEEAVRAINQQAIQEKLKAEEAVRIAAQKSEQAIQDKLKAEEATRIAAQKSEQAIQDKLKAEEAARAVNQQVILEKQEAEERVRIAAQKSEQAIQDKLKAEEVARIAAQKSEQAIQDKLKAEEVARAVNQQVILEKQEAEERVRIAAQKSEQAIQDKLKAEEAARIAAKEREQAIQDKLKAEEAARAAAAKEREQARKNENDLYKIFEEEASELQRRLQELEQENSELRSLTVMETFRPPQLPNDLNDILKHRSFFEWIDSEPRKSHEVESWLKRHGEIQSFVEISNDGYSYLNSLGKLLYAFVKVVQDDCPRVKWPKPSAIPPSNKNRVSETEHKRPKGWERFVESLCNVDCVSKVAYDENAYGGSIIKVINAQNGTLSLRYGSADLWLPLRVETTAQGEEQINLVIEYIRSRIM
jgi:hypothetical protein